MDRRTGVIGRLRPGQVDRRTPPHYPAHSHVYSRAPPCAIHADIMRTRRRQVSNVQAVAGVGSAPTPTIRNRLVRRNAEAILTAGPGGVRHDVVVGTPEARALVRLDNALLAARTDADRRDLDYVLSTLNDCNPPTDEVLRLARECAESYRLPHAQSRGEGTRARHFHRLAVALGLALPADPEPERDPVAALQRALMRARRTMGAPRPE